MGNPKKHSIINKQKSTKKKITVPLVEHTLGQEWMLEDAVMFLPLNEKEQLHVYLYKQGSIKEEYYYFIDMRKYRYIVDKFKPTKIGIEIPLKDLEQVIIRLQALLNKYKRKL